ncbi:MAG: winged helix-turn-helix transcriptional regulator [Mucilaginibacter sp.]
METGHPAIHIYSGNKRFNDISNSIPGITNRVLSKELKHLEENFLISRTIIPSYPIKIEYAITDYCLTTHRVAGPMEEWGKNHLKQLTANNHTHSDPNNQKTATSE